MSESVQVKKADFTILTVREVAEYLRMSEAKVYRLANERHLPAIRIGKSWRFRKDLLDEWLSQCTETSLKAESTESQQTKADWHGHQVRDGIAGNDRTLVCTAQQADEGSSFVGTAQPASGSRVIIPASVSSR